MLRDLLRWTLYSPARLLAVAVPALALAVLGVTWLGATGPPPAPDASAPAPPVEPSRPSAASHAPAQAGHTEARVPIRAIRATARDFLDRYVVPASARPRVVPPTLQALTTPSLWRGLRLTDPALLPRGRVDDLEVTDASPFSGVVVVGLHTGVTLRVSLVAWDDGWRVGDVQPVDDP
jgi:hypothetical protein